MEFLCVCISMSADPWNRLSIALIEVCSERQGIVFFKAKTLQLIIS